MDTVMAPATRPLHRLLKRHGLNADALFSGVGMDPAKLDDPRSRYDGEPYRNLWGIATDAIRAPCWGLGAGEVWTSTDYHALGFGFVASRTLEAGIRRAERFYSLIFSDAVLHVEVERDSVRLTHSDSSAGESASMQDACLSVLWRICRDAFGALDSLPLREVQFAHGCSGDHRAYFGCDTHPHCQTTGLVFDLRGARQALPGRNVELAAVSDRMLEELAAVLVDTSILVQVQQLVRERLDSGRATVGKVAAALGMAARTLQRHLEAEGTTFQLVLEGERRGMVEHELVAGEHGLDTIAHMAGYAHPPAFFRAYRSWTGHSPRTDRTPPPPQEKHGFAR